LKKTVRKMKVYEQSGQNYKSVPTIILKGDWLKDWGFAIHTPIIVQCEDRKLSITIQESEEGNNQENDCSHKG